MYNTSSCIAVSNCDFHVQLGAKLLDPPEFSPLDPTVNMSYIEHGSKKMHQTVANIMLSQYVQLMKDNYIMLPAFILYRGQNFF